MARWNEYERRARNDRAPPRDDDHDAGRDEHARGYGAWDPRQYGYGTDARGAGPDTHRHGAEYRRRDTQGREFRGEPRGWSADDQDWGRSPSDHPAADAAAPWSGGDERPREDHRGRGPRGYARSDERIREDVCERLTEDSRVDASDVEVAVANAEVTLTGTVSSREARRRAEDCVDAVSGVQHVQNNLRVKQPGMGAGMDVTGGSAGTGSAATGGAAPRGDGDRH